MSDFSFLCTFVPGSDKSTDGTFVPWNIRCLELSFLGSERSKNFRSCGTFVPFHSCGTFVPVELSLLWNFRSFRTNRPVQELLLQASKTI